MKDDKLILILIKFEEKSKFYVEILKKRIDSNKFESDLKYAKWMFIYHWALERQGSPYGYKITALKSLYNESFKSQFKELYGIANNIPDDISGLNVKINPFLNKHSDIIECNCIYCLNILDIIDEIKNGNIEGAYQKININGLGSKIKRFFIRDLIYLYNPDIELKINDYEFLMPIDSWLYAFRLNLNAEDNRRYYLMPYSKDKNKIYSLNDKKSDESAKFLMEKCLKFSVSPIKLNMGVWAYCARVIGSKQRLERLIYDFNQNGNIDIFDKEFEYIKSEENGINLFI